VKAIVRAACLAFAAFAATAALAQPKPALVKDVDQPARSMYQETASETSSYTGQVTCQLSFATVPAGKRLVVQWINVFYPLLSTSGDSDVQLYSVLGVQPQATAFLFQPGPNAGATGLRTVNAGVLMYVDAGAFPTMLIVAENTTFNGSVLATLSGYYVSVP